MRKTNTVMSDFYCLRCGRSGIPVMRKVSLQRESGHRKRLWCPWCQVEVNHAEIKSYEDLIEFRENFEAGIYKEEAEASIKHCEGDNDE